MSVSLIDCFKYYEGLPHQDKAIQYINDALDAGGMKHWLSEASDFGKIWRGGNSPGDQTKFIDLVDVAKDYSGLPRQEAALQHLQQSIEAELPELWDDTSDFVRIWRQQPFSPQPGYLITFDSIGLARLGMTLEDLKRVFGSDAQFQVKSPFMADFDAIAITLLGDHKPQYSIVYPSGAPLEDSDEITMLITENPKFRTSEGIGPGVLVSKAVEIYGDATFSYRAESDSQEFVRFADQPQNNADAVDSRRKFRPQALCYDFAGIYLKPTGDVNQTQEFQENACIWQVWLIQPPTSIEAAADNQESSTEVEVTESIEDILTPPEVEGTESTEDGLSLPEVEVAESTEEGLSALEEDNIAESTEDILSPPEVETPESIEDILSPSEVEAPESIEGILPQPEIVVSEPTENVLSQPKEDTMTESAEDGLSLPEVEVTESTEDGLFPPEEDTVTESTENVLSQPEEDRATESIEDVLSPSEVEAAEPTEEIFSPPQENVTEPTEDVLSQPQVNATEPTEDVLSQPQVNVIEPLGEEVSPTPEEET